MTFRAHATDNEVEVGKRFADMVEITRQVFSEFDRVQRRPWTVEVAVVELSKQVGDLARRILTIEGYYLPNRDLHPAYATTKDEVANELADILHWLIRLSLHYDIDLECAHYQARTAELAYVAYTLTECGQSASNVAPPVQGILNMPPTFEYFKADYSVAAQSVKYHYDKLLSNYYDWILGGFDQAVDTAAALFTELKILGTEDATALDLGAGTGIQSVPLAQAGFSVTAVDLSNRQLAELEKHAEDLPVRRVLGNILDPWTYADTAPFDIVVCMGDTLTHLGNLQDVYQLFFNMMRALKSGGPFILSWRDMSGPISPTGAPQAYPVRLDRDKLFTTVVAPAAPGYVSLTDMIMIRSDNGWDFGQNSYCKLRLSQTSCMQMLTACGFGIQTTFMRESMTYVVARRP